jgi:tetratricopeptide (TPR) repeat protein
VSDLSSMRARYAIETRRWDTLAAATTFGNVNELFAIGMSAARTGNARAAEVVRQKLAERATAPEEGDLRPAIAIMEREMAALVEQANGRSGAALEILAAASASELALPAPLGLPAPIKPAPELFGEALLDAGRPRDAIEPFRSVLRVHANRSLAVLGLARAAAASGDQNLAREQYRLLLASYDKADADLAEVKEARAALAATPVVAARATNIVPWVAGGVLAVAGGILVTRGSRGSRGSEGSEGSRAVKQTKSRRGGKSAPALRRGNR